MKSLKVNRIGETRIMTNGLKATIIAYRNANDLDVKFEDGTIREHTAYINFEKGNVSLKWQNRDKNAHDTHFGETRTMNNGLQATIIAYRTMNDIDVKFENGAIREHTRYLPFKNGNIALKKLVYKKKAHIGETATMSNGLQATIIAYRTMKDIDVKFENGVIREHTRYSQFKQKHIALNDNDFDKNKRIGETRTMNNGLKATIIAYRKADDIDIKFEDGTIREHTRYSRFVSGAIASIKLNVDKNKRIGETRTMNNGLNATIIAYRNNHDIDVQFENDIIKMHTYYDAFRKGTLSTKMTCNNIKIGKIAYIFNNQTNFYCHCQQCGKHDIMTVSEMKTHICNK